MTRWIISIILTIAIIISLSALPCWKKFPDTTRHDSKQSALKIFTIVSQKSDPENSLLKSTEPTANEIPALSETKKIDANKKNKPEPEPVSSAEKSDEKTDTMTGQENSTQTADSNLLANENNKAPELDENYKSYVLEKIASKKIYPREAREKNQTGKVKLHIVILPDGNLQSVEIVAPCEFEILNDSAVATVKKAAPFKKMEAAQIMDLTFSINFSLQ